MMMEKFEFYISSPNMKRIEEFFIAFDLGVQLILEFLSCASCICNPLFIPICKIIVI